MSTFSMYMCKFSTQKKRVQNSFTFNILTILPTNPMYRLGNRLSDYLSFFDVDDKKID